MGARKKLNSAYLTGSVLVAGLIGYTAGSWGVFVLALAVLVASNLVSGDVRLDQRKKGRDLRRLMAKRCRFSTCDRKESVWPSCFCWMNSM